ncbi:MAG: YhgE/Pip domain-containing protein [Bacillota bacterium]|nr:YhgE/Pip domain-containing protein [Bacillota bacterium]
MKGNIKRFRKQIVIAAVIILPLVYSFFYLDAFWDPYSRLSELPVALINQDTGAVVNGEQRNLGNEIADQLKGDKNLKWTLTNSSEASKGISKGKYYAEITIPSDFSRKISSAGNVDKTQGIIMYQPEEKRNFLAAQVMNRVMIEFKDNVSQKVTKEIVKNVIDKINQIPGSLKDLNDGLGKMASGTKDISGGISNLRNNQIQFNNGLTKLKAGLADAKSGSIQLYTGSKSLASYENTFYTSLNAGVPDILKLSQGSNLFYKSLQTLNSGLDNLNKNLSKPDTGLSAIADNAVKFGNGLQQFNKGFSAIRSGTGNLYDSTKAFSSNIKTYSEGLDQYLDSVSSLTTADKSISQFLAAYLNSHPEAMSDKNIQNILNITKQSGGSLDKINTSAGMLKTNMDTLVKASQQLEGGTKTLNDGVTAINDNSAALISGAEQLSSGVNQAGKSLSDLSGAVNQLAGGSAQLTGAYSQIDTGLKKSALSLQDAAKAAGLLSENSSKLASGANQLNSGIAAAYNGSAELNDNAVKFADGEKDLLDGSNQLATGINTMQSQITTNIGSMDALNGLDSFAASPVKLEQSSIDPVPDYGTAFSPYFISLSLWVGSILILIIIYLDPDINLRRRYSKLLHSDMRFLGFALIGIVQAVVLSLAIKFGLNLHPKSEPLFYLVTILVSLSFISVVEFLVIHLKDAGKFLVMLLLILQLTSCGGTFPMELVPGFFKIIKPFMPMTYSVNALKEAISGVNYGDLNKNMLVLGGIMVVFLAGNVLLSWVKSTKNEGIENTLEVLDI